MRKIYRIDPNDETHEVSDFLSPESHLFYDDNSKLFYSSKEHFDKTEAYKQSEQAK